MKNLLLILTCFITQLLPAQNPSVFYVKTPQGALDNVAVTHNRKPVGFTDEKGKITLHSAKEGDTIQFEKQDFFVSYIVEDHYYRKPVYITKGEYDVFQNVQNNDSLAKPAHFPEGKEAMMQWLDKHIVYPQIAIDRGDQGRCYVKFVINEDGTMSDLRVMRGVIYAPECDQELERVLQAMPLWTPAMHEGKAIRSYVEFSYKFAFEWKWAKFPGGYEAMDKWITENQEYYGRFLAKKQSPKMVRVLLTIEPDGSISGIEFPVMYFVAPRQEMKIRMEIGRLVNTMPRWTPETFNGQPREGQASMYVSFYGSKRKNLAQNK